MLAPTRLLAFPAVLGLFSAAAPVPATAGAAAPAPIYQRSADDAVTADNAPVTVARRGGGCAARPCPVPDANPADPASAVDSYTADVYERPVVPGSGGPVVAPGVDIVAARVGTDDEHFYYRIDLFGTEAGGGLPHAYAFELDYDVDPAGDLLVGVSGGRVGPGFATSGVVGWWNKNSNIVGPSPEPDGPDAAYDGYEVAAFNEGDNRIPGGPGGPDAIVARIAPDRPASLELAVRRDVLAALNDGEAVVKAAFRPGASLAPLDPAFYTLHDRFGRAEAGSPFAFLAAPGAPAACPRSDRGLPPGERMALDSGTGADTGMANPCYPSAALSGYDSAAFVVFDPRLAADAGLGRKPPDLALSATHGGDLGFGDRAVLRLAVRNVGTGPTTGPITLTDVLPAGLRPLSAAGRGWACSTSGPTVSCTTRAPLAPGAASTVALSVAVEGDRARRVTNRADVATPGDTQVANNAAADVARLTRGTGSLSVPLVASVVAGLLLAIGAWRRARRRRRLSEPATPRPCP